MSAVEVVLATEQPRTLRLERELGDGAEAIVYEAEPDLAVSCSTARPSRSRGGSRA